MSSTASLKIGIIGSGNIGRNVAKHLVEAAHDVILANSRGPESLRATVQELGPRASEATVAEAAEAAHVLLLAVPWTRKQETIAAAGGAAAFAGKIVIDAMNPYPDYPALEDLGGRTSSEVVAGLLPGAKVVKAFNTMYYETLANEAKKGSPPEERIALPICSDDEAAKMVVAALIDEIGFTAVDAGSLSQSRLQEPLQPLYNKDLKPALVRAELARRGAG
jgi:predicted dinucleotide-binding enzyme